MKIKVMAEDRHDFPDCLFLIFDTMVHMETLPTRADVRRHLADCGECRDVYDVDKYGPK